MLLLKQKTIWLDIIHPSLLKYLPAFTPSPNKLHPSSRFSIDMHQSTIPNSPCPSPTPLFQHLYFALSQWERCLSDSPACDYIKDLFNLSKDEADNRPYLARRNSMDSFCTKVTQAENKVEVSNLPKEFKNRARRQSTPASLPLKEHLNIIPSVNIQKWVPAESPIENGKN